MQEVQGCTQQRRMGQSYSSSGTKSVLRSDGTEGGVGFTMVQIVPVIVGSGFSKGLSVDDLGRGFKLNIQSDEETFKPRVFKVDHGRSVFKTGKHASSFCKIMDSDDKIKEHMEIAGHLSVSYGPLISGAGSGTYLSESVKTSRRSTLRYRSRVCHSFAHVKQDDAGVLEPVDDLASMLASNGCASDDIAERYGTKFVDQILFGCQLDVQFSVTSSEDMDLSEIMAKLKGAIGVGPLSVEFSADFARRNEESSHKLSLEISATASGVNFVCPAKPNLEEVVQLIEDFNAESKALQERADQDLEDLKRTDRMTVVGFSLANIADYLTQLSRAEASMLDEKMQSVGECVAAASLWKARLEGAKMERHTVHRYSARERELVLRPYEKQVDAEIARLKKKLKECWEYRKLPLAELVGRITPTKEIPKLDLGGGEENILHGYIGNGFISSPVRLWGSVEEVCYDYEGFTLRNDDGKVKPWMAGRLLEPNEQARVIVAAAETPEKLWLEVQIANHVLNPDVLVTQCQNDPMAPYYDPTKGELFLPEHVRKQVEDYKMRNAVPSFLSKTMLLLGGQGSGKTTLHKKLTGDIGMTSYAMQTCTKMRVSARAQGPAKDLIVVDTPGLGQSIRFDEAMEIRKALITGDVTQIVMVAPLPITCRAEDFIAGIHGNGLDSIMNCDTFKKDKDGIDVTMLKPGSSNEPLKRTQVFLVLTHRDAYESKIRELARLEGERPVFQYQRFVDEVRSRLPFVGPVAIVGPEVSVKWMYDTIVALAGYAKDWNTNYEIPLVECFREFPMSIPRPQNAGLEDILFHARSEIAARAALAREEMSAAVNQKAYDHGNKKISGNYVDMVGPTIDVIFKFLDDSFDECAMDATAKIVGVPLDELWLDASNENEMNARINVLNYVKQVLAAELSAVRGDIARQYPVGGSTAVYKACPQCNTIFLKPTGCDRLGVCGTVLKRDQDHDVPLDTPYRYEYIQDRSDPFRPIRRLKILKGQGDDLAGKDLSGIRRLFRVVQVRIQELVALRLGETEPKSGTQQVSSAGTWGCGATINWLEARVVPHAELVRKGLVPTKDIKELEVCNIPSSMSTPEFMNSLGSEFEVYSRGFEDFGLHTIQNMKLLGEILKPIIQAVVQESSDPPSSQLNAIQASHVKTILLSVQNATA
ncbi:hypothetical protein FVE85_6619 [Porphyridium purpureum]|uniref:G domain-containing protein n=1 Tax=Porphyridium purpureum TaxID=35688 RepID=A0A5J4Z7Q0_PORPP|nr:hypothetical protein FVE85_6619 [Porphyridium purpureum]|eukprot:POR4042..scf295_1